MSLTGQHVVITGGSGGVGRELSRVFANAGARVSLLGRDIAALRAIADDTGGFAAACDVTDFDAVDQALAACRAAHGPIAIALANAGSAPSEPFLETGPDEFRAAIDVNLAGVFNLWRLAAVDMAAGGWGRLIAVASTAGLKGYPYVAPYVAAKHGVVGLARAVAQELAPKAITANAICPGFIETPMLDRAIDTIAEKTGMDATQAAAALRRHNPQNRFVQAGEVAETALWLCSDAARSVNGHALAVSGGEI